MIPGPACDLRPPSFVVCRGDSTAVRSIVADMSRCHRRLVGVSTTRRPPNSSICTSDAKIERAPPPTLGRNRAARPIERSPHRAVRALRHVEREPDRRIYWRQSERDRRVETHHTLRVPRPELEQASTLRPGRRPSLCLETRPLTSPTSSARVVTARASEAPYVSTSFCRCPSVGSPRIPAPMFPTTRTDSIVFASSSEWQSVVSRNDAREEA